MTQNLLAAQVLEKKQAAQEHELNVAQEVQQALLPEELPSPEGYDCSATARNVDAIGGNYYDFLTLPDGARMIVLASASGSGIPAALVMTMARSLVQAVMSQVDSPAEALRRVNAFLAPDLRRGMYVSVLLLRLDPVSGQVTFANAGHHPLLCCRRGAQVAEAIHADGIALGFDKGPIFNRTIRDEVFSLDVGDRLMLCTRSMFETLNAGGEEIGEDVLYRVFARESAKNSRVFIPMVMHALEEARQGAAAAEDIALLTVKRLV